MHAETEHWFDEIHTHAATGIFLLTLDGRVLLQLRDERPDIHHPGMITTFGGAAEPGETPIACALRELREETGLSPRPEDLRLAGSLSWLDFRGHRTATAFYTLTGVEPATLTITEGTPILLTWHEIATDPRITANCRTLAARIAGPAAAPSSPV